MSCSLHHVNSDVFPQQTGTMKSATLDYFHLVFALHSLPSHNFFENVIVISFSLTFAI